MEIFLIDFENVQSSCFKGIEQLNDNDRIYIFYSTNCKVAVDDLLEFTKCRCRFYFKKINNGVRNALDFQLVEYLGYLIGKHKDNLDDYHFYIVSKDKGFKSIKNNIEGAKVDFCINLAKEHETVKAITPESTADALLTEVKKALPKLNTNQLDVLLPVMRKSKGLPGTVNNELQKHIKDKTFKDGKEIGAIIKAIKPILKQMK